MPVKNKIKQFLDARGITRYQFRQDTGIAQRTAYDLYAKPDQIPSSTVLEKICDAYQIQPGELLEWVPKSNKGGKGGKDAIAPNPPLLEDAATDANLETFTLRSQPR
ncbi:MAG: helix-turn-helix transcriptional regulator [Synechococcales bacterium]|nr:helix-turn-helix transcriptional regulator [Synechococcales bacterium]